MRTKKALDDGNSYLSTDLWYLTENILIREAINVDFYNILFKKRFVSTESAAQRLDGSSPRNIAFDVMVKRKSWSGRHKSADADDDDDVEEDKLTRLMRGDVHTALNLPENVKWQSQAGAVFDTLAGDFMKPVVEVVEGVLNSTSVKVVVYSGQLDLICATPGTVQWINNMKWDGIEAYKNSVRDGLSANNILEGYVRRHGNFSMYWVR